MTTVYKINNLDCAGCAKKLEIAIQKLPQINSANLVFMTQKLVVESDSTDDIYALLKNEIKNVAPSVEIEEL